MDIITKYCNNKIDHCTTTIFQFLTDDNTYVCQINNFEKILNNFRQLSIHDEIVYRLDKFSYLTILSEYFKLLLQWTHILNILDYSHKKHDVYQYKHYRHELYVEYLTSIITYY
ncbi:unnamed protein product [Rotaria sordida]|uniref:Uncharacterized protein n=2 Tax=Rotaria sordida TaxID=392033 RepID=A0A818VBI0_9BILA|nr:unnamed protein product [Rotaria sordida]